LLTYYSEEFGSINEFLYTKGFFAGGLAGAGLKGNRGGRLEVSCRGDQYRRCLRRTSCEDRLLMGLPG